MYLPHPSFFGKLAELSVPWGENSGAAFFFSGAKRGSHAYGTEDDLIWERGECEDATSSGDDKGKE